MQIAAIVSSAFFAAAAAAAAETLSLLVLEVDKRLVVPTYERAVSGDPAALDEAIGKLRKLVPDKGVKEWLEMEVEWVDSPNRLEVDEMKYRGTPRGGPKRFEVGHEFTWSRSERYVSRGLKLSEVQDQDNLYRFSFNFHHRLGADWSMSAAIATPRGALFVFEKLSAADPAATDPRWVFSTLLEKKGRTPEMEGAVDRLTNPPQGRTAVLRVPDATLGSKVEFDHSIHTDYSEGFTKSSVAFTAVKESANPRLKLKLPVLAGIEMDLVDETKPMKVVTHSGKFTMPLEKATMVQEFETLFREKTRKGSTTRSVPSERKRPEYFLESHLVQAKGK